MGITSIIIGAIITVILSIWLFGERWRPLRPSSWKFLKEAGLKRLLNLQLLHAYIYGRWTNQYINILLNKIFPRLNPARKIWLSDHYHGKILTPEHAHSIITNDKDIPLQDLEQVIPYKKAREIVLIKLLQSEHERGHLHSAWFKDACIDRFYSICNCCKCCCGGIEAMVKHDIPMMASSGQRSQIKIFALPVALAQMYVLSMPSDNEISAVVDWELCMGCGICVDQCPNEAISLLLDEKKGVPLDVRLLA